MLTLRRSQDRGHYDWGWLDTRHTFSFGDYHDDRFMGFRVLRVINEDRVRAGAGFPTHPHRDMEILTWVLEGGLAHKDSLGTGSTIRPGDVQRMSAGTGVTHSEFNASKTEGVHFLQIWIIPERRGFAPGYEQKAFPPEVRKDRLALVASKDGRDGSVRLNQAVDLFAADLGTGATVEHTLAAGRNAWIQVTSGGVQVDGVTLDTGDGAAVTGVTKVTVTAIRPAGFLLFDLP